MTNEAEAARLAKRYPWSQYKGPEHQCRVSSYAEHAAERQAWHEARPYRVTWVVPDSRPGLHGWRYETAVFKTEAEARAVAEAPMGIAREVRLDVSNNGWKGYEKGAKVVKLYSRKNSNLTKRR